MIRDSSFKREVYKLVKKIPKGKVMTYGQVAQELGKPRWARQVGWALHQNDFGSGVPCHRVVDRTGRLAPNFAFEGAQEQKRRLLTENVKFLDNGHVDMKECLWVKE